MVLSPNKWLQILRSRTLRHLVEVAAMVENCSGVLEAVAMVENYSVTTATQGSYRKIVEAHFVIGAPAINSRKKRNHENA